MDFLKKLSKLNPLDKLTQTNNPVSKLTDKINPLSKLTDKINPLDLLMSQLNPLSGFKALILQYLQSELKRILESKPNKDDLESLKAKIEESEAQLLELKKALNAKLKELKD